MSAPYQAIPSLQKLVSPLEIHMSKQCPLHAYM